LTRNVDRLPLNIFVIRDGWSLSIGGELHPSIGYGELLAHAFRKEHSVTSIITDGWSERIAVQAKSGRTLRSLCKVLTRVGARIDREFARGVIDVSVDRNHRSIPVSPDLIVVIESAARAKFDFSKFQAPTAFVVTDPYIGFEEHTKEMGIQAYDYVFVTQRDCVDKYKEAGCVNVQWLPPACDPEIHRRVNVPSQFDVCFVGNIHPRWGTERKRLLELVGKNFENHWFGQNFRYGRRMTCLYSSSKIVFNKSILGELNMRVFEGLASASLLITDRIQNGLLELFSEKKDLICYETDDELISAIRYYLQHAEEREKIGRHGYRTVMKNHTFDDRARQIVNTMLP